jgi:hypothetical protein
LAKKIVAAMHQFEQRSIAHNHSRSKMILLISRRTAIPESK